MQVTFGNDTLTLLPSHAAHDEARRTVFVADLHLGKTSAFREAGLALPDGSDDDTLERLSRVVYSTNASQLVILGDLFHARIEGFEKVISNLRDWHERHRIEWIIVPGNHDRRVPWKEWIPWAEILPEGANVGPWRVSHHPSDDNESLTLCGHLHPAISLGNARMSRMKTPCFWRRGNCLVLPAFGAFTGLSRIEREPDDAVWVPCEDRVVSVPRPRAHVV
jgi:uncharacterized protein